MRTIVKFLIFVSLVSVSLIANIETINEYKSDLYYANGIMMGETEVKARIIWQQESNKLFLNNKEAIDSIGKADIAYNASEDFFNDIYESYQQANNEEGWIEYNNYIPSYFENGIPDEIDQHRVDLTRQIQAYKNSIQLGHGVIVVAHSQGNYYTNEAYIALDVWMRQYFHMISVASPSSYVSGGGPHVRFQNDIIKIVPTALAGTHDDPNPNHFPLISYDAHDFYKSYMSSDNTRTFIQNFILTKIQEHKNAPSQWEISDGLTKLIEEFKRLVYQSDINMKMEEILIYLGRSDIDISSGEIQESITEANIMFIINSFARKKVTVRHKYDTSITLMNGVEVYPFNLDRKLYRVAIDSNQGNGWVLASYGAQEVFYRNNAYIINNSNNEWISTQRPFLAMSETSICFSEDGEETGVNFTSGLIDSSFVPKEISIYEDTSATLRSILPSQVRDIRGNIPLFRCPYYQVIIPFDGYKFFTTPGQNTIQNNHLRSFANKLNSAFFGNRYLITF